MQDVSRGHDDRELRGTERHEKKKKEHQLPPALEKLSLTVRI